MPRKYVLQLTRTRVGEEVRPPPDRFGPMSCLYGKPTPFFSSMETTIYQSHLSESHLFTHDGTLTHLAKFGNLTSSIISKIINYFSKNCVLRIDFSRKVCVYLS